METPEIIAKAKEYISLEKESIFRTQVEELIGKNDIAELSDRFYTELEFGTGGIRGVIGGGYNRLNCYIIRKTTQGLANYIKKASAGPSSVAIAYDSRNFSAAFALDAALVLAGNGIKAYLYTSLRSTPQLSFTVRKLGATAGIVITASHNPREYNGYKVYWSDGGQIVAPHDKGIVAEVRAVRPSQIAGIEKDEALSKGLLVLIDKTEDTAFIGMVKSCVLRPSLVRDKGADLRVVYTPLHGTGAIPVERALSDCGVNVTFVEEQRLPDGNFPTVAYPNPEEASAMKLALDLAKKESAHLVLATDPDADRLGIAVPDGTGEFVLLSGNQLGALLLDYILLSRKELGTLPARGAFVKSIVTTELGSLIARAYGVESFDVLTGFKFIGEKMREFESAPNGHAYLFGTEESYGFLVNTSVRDKDAVSAAVLTAEMTLYHLSQGRSLLDSLNVLYEKYGFFQETQVSRYFKGQSGVAVMGALMARLRTTPPASLGPAHIVSVKDYKDGTVLNTKTGVRAKSIALPSSNVLQFVCDDGSVVTARPSGTEPKIKFYASCRGESGMPLAKARVAVATKIEAIRAGITSLLDGGK